MVRQIEQSLMQCGFSRIVGVDEVGRGPLAGPVVAAAVHIPPEIDLEGIGDSKKLTPRQRLLAFQEILRWGEVSVGVATSAEIDRVNILNATYLAMRRAIQGLTPAPQICLIDGNRPVPGLSVPQQAIVRGDSQCFLIAAASIVAKVVRDRFMEDYHQMFPEYGFSRNKGYPTAEHREAILRHGLCPIHRVTFGKAV